MNSLAFDQPWFLLLLALLPLVWWSSYRSLSGLGGARRGLALGLRSIVLILVILALAEMQLVRTSERLTVLYLVDESLSIPAEARREIHKLVNRSVQQHRDRDHQDRAGVVVFGGDAAVEIPPFDDDLQLGSRIESAVELEYTNLAEALELAAALFPHDSAKRIVIISDGNENLGGALAPAQALSDAGVSIDVVPVRIEARRDVAVEKVTVASEVRRGQPFNMRVVLNNGSDQGAVRGKLRISRRTGEHLETIAEQDVHLPPGKRVLTIRQQIEEADFYTYEARFVPERPRDDAVPQNNRATTYTFVRGRGHVLLIEDWENRGQFDQVATALRRENLNVTVQSSDALFTSLADLQRYDAVILANVPRSSGSVERLTNFSDAQIDMLVENTEQLGSGLVMLGGPNSFGAGGWANTELEKAMPVDFQIKNTKVVPSGALVLVIDKSGSMSGEKIMMSRLAAREAVKVLGSRDFIGVVAFDSIPQWVVPMRSADNRQAIAKRISRLTAGGGTDMYPGMEQGYQALRNAEAAVKHMIVLTDGQTPGADFLKLTRRMRAEKIGVSTVAVGDGAARQLLSSIATQGGGKFYHVKSFRAIPRIFIKEAMRVARPLVHEQRPGFVPQLVYPHEILQGIEEPLPPMTGFVLTTVKDNPLVEVSLLSPQPATRENATLLASWTYGAGKAVAFTSDAGNRWTTAWTEWDGYSKLFSQMVRWSMRPTDGSADFIVTTEVEDGRGRIVITALDKQEEFLNFLTMTGAVVGPGRKPRDLQVRQIAPGRYLGEFEAREAGNYFVMVNPGGKHQSLRAGLSVPYSEEFHDRQSNLALLESLARLKPRGGEPGRVGELLEAPYEASGDAALNPFRRDFPKSTASQDVWHLLVLIGSCLFFFDVCNRRVQISAAWVAPLLMRLRDQLLRREASAATTETMSRLRSRKAAIDQGLASRRAASRFEPSPDAPAEISTLHEAEVSTSKKPAAASPAIAPEQREPESYTERLLKAKRKVWDQRDSHGQ